MVYNIKLTKLIKHLLNMVNENKLLYNDKLYDSLNKNTI